MSFFTGKLPRAGFLLGSFTISGALLATTLLTAEIANAADDVVSVFDVRKNLPLHPSEPTYKDFYLNAGPEAGLKKGMFVTVVRKVPIHDPLQNKAQATLSVDVAKIQIVHVERNISVARLVDDVDTAYRPVLEYEGIMIGDILDLTSISMEGPNKRGGRSNTADTNSVESGVVESSSEAPVETAQAEGATVILPAPPAPKKSEKDTREGSRKVDSVAPPRAVENKATPAPPVPDMVHALHEPDKII